jgi:hypothetical protein
MTWPGRECARARAMEPFVPGPLKAAGLRAAWLLGLLGLAREFARFSSDNGQ